jgi:hypothetical protein
MTVGLNNTALLDLPLPVEGYFDGSWGDLVNNALTNYLDIAIAGTSTFTGDGAVTLDNTAGDDSVSNITANSAQYAIIKVSGTLTTTKVITVGTVSSPAVSKIYIVDNAGTGGAVTFKAYGQTGVSVAVGEKCVVYFNGTDFVKVASSVVDGVSTISFGSTGLTPSTATSGAVTVAGTLAVASGGTGVSTSTGSGSVVLSTAPTLTSPVLVTPVLGTPASGNFSSGTFTWPTFNQNTTGTAAGLSSVLAVASGGNGTATPALTQGANITITGTWPNYTIAASAPGTGTVTSVSGTGTVSGISLSGTVTSTGNLTLSGTLAVTPSNFASQTANTILAAPNGSSGTPTFRALAAADVPTLNQNTTGTAASTPLLQTTNFSISEVGGELVFKYGATTIASMDSSGNLTTIANVTAYGTP